MKKTIFIIFSILLCFSLFESKIENVEKTENVPTEITGSPFFSLFLGVKLKFDVEGLGTLDKIVWEITDLALISDWRYGLKDKRKFMNIALTSLREVQCLCRLENLHKLSKKADRLGAMLYALNRNLTETVTGTDTGTENHRVVDCHARLYPFDFPGIHSHTHPGNRKTDHHGLQGERPYSGGDFKRCLHFYG